MGAIRGKGQDILAAIRSDKEIKPETEAKLKAFLDDFSKAFQ
jgi:F-type H+-transporting ATPase subunit alpha